MTDYKYVKMSGVVIGIIGFGLLNFLDWKIALGVFLCMWGDNMARTPRFKV